MSKMKIAIVGATGYTGSELVRLLTNHPNVEIAAITSESKAGQKFSDIHPQFLSICDLELQRADSINDAGLDAVFLALPHGVSMDYVKKWKDQNWKTIDLSGDFRLDSPDIYNQWYQKDHTFTEGFAGAAYGLPELNREAISKAGLIANPGCYPTSAILALAPLVKNELIDTGSIISDSKSGTTGAGIKVKEVTHFSNVNDNFQAYGLLKHRHTPEISGTLGKLTDGHVEVLFTPHLLPVDRGILTTTYSTPLADITQEKLNAVYRDFYRDAPFVRVRNAPPSLKFVRGTNYCDVFATYDHRTNKVLTVSVIDNLVKGAAGQAVQNFNLAFGLDESAGLHQVPLMP